MFRDFLSNPLINTYFFHTNRIRNYIGMIADAVDNRLFAELP